MRPTRTIVAALTICALAVLGPAMAKAGRGAASAGSELDSSGLAAISVASTWVNSDPVPLSRLRGRVVLVQFWTYSCVNWLRTLPYVRAWASRYKDQGLVVIGVHSPEFEFEKDLANVRRAASDLAVDYPIVLDSKHAIWQAWSNEYWPALYLVDAQGRIRYSHFGEGQYAQTEQVLQDLLGETGGSAASRTLVSVQASGAELAADHGNLRSAEDYVGLDQARHFSSPGGASPGNRRTYAFPRSLGLNQWAVSGEWTMSGSQAVLDKEGGRAAYCFHARDLNLVMGPQTRDRPLRFRVLIDGKPPGAAHGTDVDALGYGVADYPRMYQLIRQTTGTRERRFEIEFLDTGATLYAFTFG